MNIASISKKIAAPTLIRASFNLTFNTMSFPPFLFHKTFGTFRHLEEGDLVFIPHGASHWIADHPDSKLVSSIAYVKAMENGMHLFDGNGEKTVFVGGHFEYESEPLHPFIKDLPRYIHIGNLK